MENQLCFGAACWQRPRGAVSSLQRTPKGLRAACPHSQEDTGALCPHPAGFLPASSSPPLLHPTPPLQKPSPKAGRRSGAPGLVAGGQAARLPAARFPALRQLREELGSPAPCLLPAPWRAPLQLGCLLARRAVCLGLLSKTWQGAHGKGLGSPKPLSAAAPLTEAVLGQRPPRAASVSPLQSSPLCVQGVLQTLLPGSQGFAFVQPLIFLPPSVADCKPLFPFLQPALKYLRHAYGLCHHPGDSWCLAPPRRGQQQAQIAAGMLLVDAAGDLLGFGERGFLSLTLSTSAPCPGSRCSLPGSVFPNKSVPKKKKGGQRGALPSSPSSGARCCVTRTRCLLFSLNICI